MKVGRKDDENNDSRRKEGRKEGEKEGRKEEKNMHGHLIPVSGAEKEKGRKGMKENILHTKEKKMKAFSEALK